MLGPQTRIAIAGAGSIGCHAGGCLALAGRKVSLLARQRIAESADAHGMVVADLDRGARMLARGAIQATPDPAVALAGAGLVLVTVKSGDTADIAALIAAYASADAVVVSLQNGVGNAQLLRSALPASQRVVAGMVPFNVVQSQTPGGALRFHRATSGTTLVEHNVPGLVELLAAAGFPVAAHPDMPAVLWGKLLLNLNNALNALSGLPLAEQLADREWRIVLATQMQEALTAMRGADIRPAQVGGLKPGVLPHLLRLPDFIFRRLARRILAVDPAARSSTWEDLSRGRRTEIDAFQGEVIRLAAKAGTAAPLSRLVMESVRAAEALGKGSPGLQPSDFTLPRG